MSGAFCVEWCVITRHRTRNAPLNEEGEGGEAGGEGSGQFGTGDDRDHGLHRHRGGEGRTGQRGKATMRRPLLIDGRNIWASYGLRTQGFLYEGIGVRGT